MKRNEELIDYSMYDPTFIQLTQVRLSVNLILRSYLQLSVDYIRYIRFIWNYIERPKHFEKQKQKEKTVSHT